VAETSWARSLGEEPAQLAARLGVQVDVLEDAQRLLDARAGAAGRFHSKIQGRWSYQRRVKVAVPLPILEDLRAYAEVRKRSVSDIIRSLIHDVLIRPTNPPTSVWRHQGKIVRLTRSEVHKGKDGKGHIHMACTDISYGALEALNRRARGAGTKASGLIRAAIMQLLTERTKELPIVSVSEMWHDPDRYWTEADG